MTETAAIQTDAEVGSMRFARVAGGVAVGIGVSTLVGWWFDVPMLRQVLPGLAEMKPNTALGFIACGTGLLTGIGWARRAAGLLAASIGAATLVEYAVGSLGIDGLLVGATGDGRVLRMTPAAATGFLSGGLALSLTSCVPSGLRWMRRLEVGLSLGPLVVGMLALLGYLYGARSLYATTIYSSMALHTASLMTLMGAGLAASRPRQGITALLLSPGVGGVMARRLTAYFVLLAPLMGWVSMRWQESGWYDYRFGLALMIASLMAAGVGLIFWTARSLERLDASRSAAQSRLGESVLRERAGTVQREAILEALPQGIVLLSGQGRVVSFNRRWTWLCGAEPDSAWVGSPFAEFCAHMVGLASPACAAASEAVRKVIQGELDGCVEEFPIGVGEPDRARWLEVRVAPVVTGMSGRGALVLVSEVSERRRLEDQLVQAQKLEAVGRLAGGIAHDFNNLLTAVMGHGSLAAAAVKEGRSPGASLEAIEQAARSGAVLTADLLAFGRRQVLEPRVVEAESLIGSVRRLMERGLGESVRLSVQVAAGTSAARVDPARIEQVLLNLVINARDAMPTGGVVELEVFNADLGIAYAQENPGVTPGRYVCIAVSDHGTGMSKVVQARVFEPFFTTKELGKGTGLGLATSFGIVKQHGGHITVYSEEGRGSTFRVYLPAADAVVGSGTDPVSAGAVAARGGRERVLLIDDHPGARSAVAGMLRSLGYSVVEAADGAAGEGVLGELLLRGERFDLVICDVVLPDGTGPELVARLRERAGMGLAVLFISGYTSNAIVHKGVLDGGVHYLAKPFGSEELDSKVRGAMGKAEGV